MSDLLKEWIAQDYDMGEEIDSVDDNIFDGEDFYDEENSIIGHSEETIVERENLYDEQNQHEGYRVENDLGGEDYFNEQNQLIGYTSQESISGEETLFNAENQKVESIDELDSESLAFEEVTVMQTSWEYRMLSVNTFESTMSNLTFPPLL